MHPALIVTGAIRRGDASSAGSALVAFQARLSFWQPVARRTPCQPACVPPGKPGLGGDGMGHRTLSLPSHDPLARQRGWFCLGGARWLPGSVVRSREMALMSLAGSPPHPGSSRSSSLRTPHEAWWKGWGICWQGMVLRLPWDFETHTPPPPPDATPRLFVAIEG